MGIAKLIYYELLAKEERWEHVCRKKGFTCSRCGDYPTFDERHGYFLHHMCGHCHHMTTKDD